MKMRGKAVGNVKILSWFGKVFGALKSNEKQVKKLYSALKSRRDPFALLGAWDIENQ